VLQDRIVDLVPWSHPDQGRASHADSENSCYKSSVVAEMGDCLATIDICRKMGGYCAPFRFGGAGSPSNTMSPGPRPTSIPSSILIHPEEAAVPFPWWRAGFSSNTMLPGPRPTSIPSGILIHPTIWPQYTNVTDNTDRQDSGPVA